MKCVGISMKSLPLSALSLLACVMNLKASRYGDYAIGNMPQYGDHQVDSDSAVRHGDYNDRSPDAAAQPDYKYEEELHEKLDDIPMRDNDEERVLDSPKKKRPPVSLGMTNLNLHKYSLDETEPEIKSSKRFVIPNIPNRNFAQQSDSRRRWKYNLVVNNDNIDDVQTRNDYVLTEDVERSNDVDHEENSSFAQRSTRVKKPRRKPRERTLNKLDGSEQNKNIKLLEEGVDVRPNIKKNFKTKRLRNFGEIIDRQEVRKIDDKNYNYDEYYDVKRVQNIKSRLPALFRQPTVRTMEAESTSNSKHWLNRRAGSLDEHSVRNFIVNKVTVTVTNTTLASTTTSNLATTLKSVTSLPMGNSSDVSLAEKSRLSILKKAQRKEIMRNVTVSTKPPVLMQVTRNMQTVVMVEPRSPETAMRARDVLDDSPEQLKRARRLMRHKLVAAARSIHELTDNWDEMVCDYIDVSLLDTDAASLVPIDIFVTQVLLLLVLLIYN